MKNLKKVLHFISYPTEYTNYGGFNVISIWNAHRHNHYLVKYDYYGDIKTWYVVDLLRGHHNFFHKSEKDLVDLIKDL